ncbi:Serine protease inhibitor Kazal-type 5 [Phytophthora pseudosyringae]|uniref:Serine protease inhibitor Kazal-type 5 n=1 Tax=Phytophthora pseudosyringae TaxID=221518 RepID=A0A8T1VP94_9STRA|nr:Serine protease inhibitor Kazal-type 5 [Phytophthora pseudosyringae]
MPRKESTAAVIVDSPARRRGPKPLLSVEQEMQLVQWKGEDDSSTEEETLLSSGGDNDSSKCAQSTDVQQEVTPVSEVEEKREPSQKRPEAVWSGDPAASPKRQKTEAKTSAVHSPTTSRSVRSSDSTRRGSILPERRQSEKAESIEKLDAIMQSNHRLEAMQRQQLEMLQQLCASNKVMSSITGATLATSCSRECGEYEQCFVYNEAEYCAPLCAPGRCDQDKSCILRGVVPCTSEPCLPEAVCEPRQSPIVNVTGTATSSACKLNCQLVSSPVCGSDNVSYANSCFLKEARCTTGNTSLFVTSRGLCEGEKALNAAYNSLISTLAPTWSTCLATVTCADVLDPVCTSAGTMRNLCYFKRQQRCSQTSVALIRTGACEDSNVMPLCPATCAQTYSPVCASSGQLYGNECLFRQAKCARRDLVAVNIELRTLSECDE